MTQNRSDGFDDVVTVLTPQRRRPAEADAFVVRVLSGPNAGASFTLSPTQPTRALIGQSPACDLRLDDRQVSRRHLAIEPADGNLRLTDLESTNGTRALLSGGERVELGGSVLEISRTQPATRAALTQATSFGTLLGASPVMRRIYPLCERLAASSVPVVIEGETGTGKEVLAESLHEKGPRSSGPFVVFDCTAVPANLLESALFGHERGAFTGATESRRGVFEEAHGGTLLIDEIGDLELELQAKLLRALERSEVRRLGGKAWKRVDVRVLAATRRDLDQLVQAGRFRDDLFYRLAVARIELPPLRRREGDVALLARAFWQRMGGGGELPEPFAARLEGYGWPGNVRELHNAVARQVALGDLADDLQRSTAVGASAPVNGGDLVSTILALDLPLPRAREKMVSEFEARYVERVLAQHGGNVTRAAQASGIAHRYFQLLRARVARRDPST
jgi:DNA-binding NtrC family response regulator